MRVLPCGDRALLAEFDTLDLALGAHAAWSAAAPPGIVELVPGARTVLVRLDPGVIGLGHAEYWMREHPPIEPSLADGATVSLPVTLLPATMLPVTYDGDDLAVVAEAWGCSLEAVPRHHAELEWVCAFVGFAPGFSYLVPAPGQKTLPPVPRRATSRPRVPAGAVALAAEYCGVYPRESPGGWQLIGHTTALLWDADRAEPALVTPGARVRFTEVRP